MTELQRGQVQRAPTHPGTILREDVLPALNLSVSAFARGVHTSRQTAHKILAGKKSITPEMALKIAKYTGSNPSLWLRMQQSYDLYVASVVMADELDDIQACCA